jgi:hypothetical protein
MPPAATTGDRRDGIDDLRHQRHRRDAAGIAARLAALGDDDVDAALGRLDGLRDGGDLQHHLSRRHRGLA